MADATPHTNSIIIPSDPKTQQAIRNAVKQIDASMTRIKGEQDNIAQILLDMKEKTEVKGSVIRNMAKIYHNQNLVEKQTEWEDLEALYDVVILNGND